MAENKKAPLWSSYAFLLAVPIGLYRNGRAWRKFAYIRLAGSGTADSGGYCWRCRWSDRIKIAAIKASKNNNYIDFIDYFMDFVNCKF